jgi:DNA invertase Pin-like site-specific DNA recombinase
MSEAVIYCRASKDRTGAGLSVAGQESDCRDFATAHNLTVRAVYADNDITASGKKIRPAYRQMLADLAEHPGNTVIVWHTDRLHRHLAELEEYIALAEDNGMVTRAVRAGDLDLATPSGRMVARMLGVVARHELEHMSERRKAGKARAAAAGRWKGGRRPLGYARDGVTVVPDEAAAIVRASADILAGVSLHAVTRSWNARGVLTTTGNRWTPREVSRVLRRPRNAGLMEHQGKVLGTAEWPPIVDEETWRGVCAILSDPARKTTPGPERRWLLSGIAECSVCGDGTAVIASKMGGHGRPMRPVYRCRSRQDGRKHIARDVAALDAYVTELALERLRLPDLAQAVRPARSRNGAAPLHAQMIGARQRLDEAAGLYAAGTIDAAQLTTITGKLNAELDDLGRKLAELARRDALAEFTGRDPAKVWEGLDLARRRAVIQALMRVILDPAPRGRPAGWRPGQPYLDRASIRIEWHR